MAMPERRKIMNRQTNDTENAEIQRTVSQSELIEPLGTGWQSVATPPEMTENVYGWLQSKDVLAIQCGGSMLVAKYEQLDSECEPRWTSCCSEGWTLTTLTHWMPLPAPPEST